MFFTLTTVILGGSLLALIATAVTGWDAVILAAINLIHLCVSTYNARRINTVRHEQKRVADTVLNGAGKEVK